ncbi:MAG TPA: rRNA adenine N-6-methyltransferase family protein, partial [Acidimicrobiia bacterium]|nr:rRNA adenine N-6-methyltransferase family protein [Acidimicrobiia bacterium]
MASSYRRWGWHRLDPVWAQRLVADANLPRGAVVLDVGAGLGAVTRALVDNGARVVAVEQHAGRAQQLRDTFAGVIVVQADARDLRLPRRPFHVVANPPFAVTGALIARLLQRNSRLVSAHLVVQEQAARRWAGPAAPAVTRWHTMFGVSLGRRIPRR